MTDELEIHIGSIGDMGKRFVEAWRDAERGPTRSREHVTFLSLEAFSAAVSPRRLALIRALHAGGAMSIRALAKLVARDYKSVHGDVMLLVGAGLMKRDAKDRISVGWTTALAELNLAA